MKSSSLKLLTITALSLLLTTTLSAEIVRTQNYKANVDKDATVELSGDIADIVMVPSTSDEVSLEVTYKFKTDSEEKADAIQEKIKVTYEANAGKVLFKEENKNKKKLLQETKVYISILAHIPEGPTVKASSVSGDVDSALSQNRLYVESVSGDIKLQDLQQSVDAETVSGDIKAKSIAGNFHAESVSGDIHAGTISKDVTVENVSGDISLTTAQGNIHVETVSGDIQLKLAQEPFALNAENVSGDIAIVCTETMNLKVNLESTSGSVSCSYALSNLNKKRNRLNGTLGTGNILISAETVSGDVSLK